MKKVLIITYYWPPSGGAGVQRWLKFVKYLRDFGWEPVVYTPENPEAPAIDQSLLKDIPEDLTVVKKPIWEPYTVYKKFIGQKKESRINAGFLSESKKPKFSENISVWIRGNFFIPDARKFWIKPSVKFLTKYLKENPVDAIVSTGPPHSMHMIALGIKKKLNLPWLADFRDPWTNIDFYDELRLTAKADRKHHKLEKLALSNADKITVISPGMAEDFSSILNRQYDVITNGYDEDDIPQQETVTLDKQFSITHIGSIGKSRNPNVLWEVLKEKIKQDTAFAEMLKIKLVGKVDYVVNESLLNFILNKYVERIEYLPHDKLHKYQQESQVLLLLINDTPNAKLILTGKFFEYIGSRRPVLCIGPEDGNAAQIIKENQFGEVCNFQDKQKLTQIINEFFNLYNKNSLVSKGKDREQFTRKKLTADMADLLNEMIKKS